MKQVAIITAVYGLLSKELEDYLERAGYKTPSDFNLERDITAVLVFRTLQRMEGQLAPYIANGQAPKIEEYINGHIEAINSEMDIIEHIHAVVGITLLSLYREKWVGKKQFTNIITWDRTNEIYYGIEAEYMARGKSKDRRQVIVNSQILAEKLYERIVNDESEK